MEINDVAESFQRNPAKPFDVAAATFPLIRRGFDPTQVSWFLQTVAEDIAGHEMRAQQLEADLATARQELSAASRIDEVTVAHFLGEESARMLTAARDTAQDLTERAEAKSAAAIAAAEATAATLRRDAETDTRRLRKETEAACSAAIEEAEARAARIVADAEAQRRQVLADLTRRREVAAAQFTELMAGRDALVRSLASVEMTARALTSDLTDFSLLPANFVSVAEAVQDTPIIDPSVTSKIVRVPVAERVSDKQDALG